MGLGGGVGVLIAGIVVGYLGCGGRWGGGPWRSEHGGGPERSR